MALARFSPFRAVWICRRGQNVGGSVIAPTRNVAYAMAFDRSFPQSLASPVIADSEHFWPRFRCSPLRLKTAASFGSRDYDLRLAIRFSRHRSCVTVSGAYVCACGHKLSLTAALSLTPTPPAAPTVSARYRSAVNPMPPLAFPSRRCRSASFLPPIARMPY